MGKAIAFFLSKINYGNHEEFKKIIQSSCSPNERSDALAPARKPASTRSGYWDNYRHEQPGYQGDNKENKSGLRPWRT